MAGHRHALSELRGTAPRTDGALRLWWLGQSGFLVQWRGHHLLLDPYLSDSLTAKYAATDKPHVRMTARAVDPGRLDMIEVVTSSHNHTDHLDHETLWPLLAANPGLTLVIPEANRQFVADRLHADPAWPIGVTDGSSVDVGPFHLTGIAVAHEQLDADDQGRALHLGYLVAVGPFTLFHSGDAIPYDGMESRLLELAGGRTIDVALLPINGRLPERRVPGNFWGDEAVRFARRDRCPIGRADALRDVCLQHRDARAVRVDGAGARPAVPRAALWRATDDPRRGDTCR